MSLRSYNEDGVLREFHDDESRTHYFYGENGQTIGSEPYSPEEIAALETEILAQAAELQREADRTAIKAIIADLQAEKARVQVVIDKANNAITGGDTKDVARAAKRIADAAIDLARFVKDM